MQEEKENNTPKKQKKVNENNHDFEIRKNMQ